MGVGFCLVGKDISVSVPEEINKFNQAIETALITADEGIRLQVFFELSSDADKLISTHCAISGRSSSALKSIVASRAAFHYQKSRKGNYFEPNVYLFIRSDPNQYKRQRLFEKPEKFKQVCEEEYQVQKKRFERQSVQIFSSLVAAGLDPKKLDERTWSNLLFRYFNLERSERIGIPTFSTSDCPLSSSITNQLILSDVTVFPRHIQIGKRLFRPHSLKTLPEETQAGMGEVLTQLPFHCWIIQNLKIENQRAEYDRLQMKRRFAHSMAAGSGNMRDIESESKLGQIEGLISELLESSEKIISTDLNVIVWADNLEELEEKSDEVLRSFRNLNQAEGIAETHPSFDCFINSYPGSCTGFRMKRVKSSNAAHLMPLYSYWRGNKNPVCLLPNRDNVLVGIDPFDPVLPNWNGFVIGSSGSGKSFTINQFVLMFLGDSSEEGASLNSKVVWIDNGASSQGLIDCLDGQFVDLRLDSGIVINAFDLSEGETEPSPNKVKLILAVIETICKEEGSRGIPKREKALIEEAIVKTYSSQTNTPTMSDFRRTLVDSKIDSLKHYSDILYSWTGNSAFGKILDGKTNIELSNRIVTIEVKSLDQYPELQSVVLLLLTEYIMREASSNINQKYLLVIDEIWKILQNESAAQFVIECYRTMRKFYGGIWGITQSIKDFTLNKEVSSAVLQNTPTRIILRQRGVDWDDFKSILSLTTSETDAIKNLRNEKGKFSELFFIQDDNKTVLRLEPDPLSYWITTTDPIDKTKIQSAIDDNPDLSSLEIRKLISKDAGKSEEI